MAMCHPVLDVRSPSEYLHAHIPGAINLPLFSDEERKIVGTTYKQVSREQAIKIGLDYFGPKMRMIVEQCEQLVHKKNESDASGSLDKILLIHCWRGGMRSGAVAWLMDLYGYKIYTLSGGYKSFRNWVIKSFTKEYPIRILGGYTGSGKTELLHALQRSGEDMLDLEGIAKHKGSAFGETGVPQPSQEQFENELASFLRKYTANTNPAKTLWVEDESQRIGNLNIPIDLWMRMRRSPTIFLKIPFEERLVYIVREYGTLSHDAIKNAIIRIQKRLGGLDAKNSLAFLEAGDLKECFRILLRYYDKHYQKGLEQRTEVSKAVLEVECAKVTVANVNSILGVFQASGA